MTTTLVAIALVAIGVVLLSGWLFLQWEAEKEAHSRTRADLARETVEHVATSQRLRVTEERSSDLVVAVSPLIEKTDWMTGRWNGQFQSLVAMENKRNQQVAEARKAIFAIPSVKEAGIAQVAQGLPGHLTLSSR